MSSSVSVRKACRRLSSKSGNSRMSGVHRVEVAQMQPLRREVGDQVARSRIREHPRDLPLEHGRLVEIASGRQVQQFVVRDAAPQKEREPRRQLEIADRDTAFLARLPPDRARCGTEIPGSREPPTAPFQRRRQNRRTLSRSRYNSNGFCRSASVTGRR